MALNLKPDQAGIAVPDTEHGVWGIVMDTSFADSGTYTTVALLDGTASIYIGDQSGVIGGFSHPFVRLAAQQAVSLGESYVAQFRPADILPLPKPAHTRFYLLTRTGRVESGEILEENLGHGKHPVSPLFRAMHEVIGQLRIVSEQQKPGS